ncbi:Hsp20/alpha crystallin family protein, partial [candidate division KSB1 bacterium]|nr:Hsp20/alpha crystallin family protein [candidate division KSB1 bacterium]
MYLIKRNPAHALRNWFNDDWHNELTHFFEDDSVAWSPRVDVEESKDAYKVIADLPGLKKDEIKITLHDNILTLKGERNSEKEENKEEYQYRERVHGSFCRSFRMPAQVKQEEIKADYKNGVLEILLPKAEEAKP